MAPLLGLLDLRNDHERMDYYMNADNNDDLEGLVDVLAASAGSKSAPGRWQQICPCAGSNVVSCFSSGSGVARARGSTQKASSSSDVVMVSSSEVLTIVSDDDDVQGDVNEAEIQCVDVRSSS